MINVEQWKLSRRQTVACEERSATDEYVLKRSNEEHEKKGDYKRAQS